MKTILITGARSGLGKLLTENLATQGKYRVMATLRNSGGQYLEVKKAFEKLPHTEAHEPDVTSPAGIHQGMA